MEDLMKNMNLITAVLGLALAPYAANLKIGAFVGSASDTNLDGSYPQPTQKNVAAFVALQARPLDYVVNYVIWPARWSTAKTYADIAANNGATLCITWQPNGYSAPDINSGTADAYITQFANDIKSYPHEVWLRPLHEANGGDWYPWNVGNSSMLNTNENVAAAYQHIVTLFKNAGVTNVKWVWTTNATNADGGNPTSFIGTYPGDAYVDYISIDGYNFGTFHTVANSGWASSWQTFARVFSAPYKAISSINKPMFVGEFSSSELGGNKAQWYRDAFASLATGFPKFFALMVFSLNDANGDWRINTTDASIQAWKEGISQYAPVSTGISSRPAASPTTFARATGPGRIAFDLASSGNVRIRTTDLRGHLLENRDLGQLSAGAHSLDLGSSRNIRIVTLQAGSLTTSLRLGMD
jgi:Glycosyl hydrolase family 26